MMEKKPISHFTAGIVTAVVAYVLFFVYYYTGKSFETNFLSIIPYIISTGLVIMFVLIYAKANNNNVTYGELFGYGFRITMIFSLLMVAFIVAIFYVLPAYKEKYMDVMRSHLAIDKNMTKKQKEITLNTTSEHFRMIQVGFNLFMNLIAGTLGALIGASIARKKEQPASAIKE